MANVFCGRLESITEKTVMSLQSPEENKTICKGKIVFRAGNVTITVPYIAKGAVVDDLIQYNIGDEIQFIAELSSMRENMDGIAVYMAGFDVLMIDKEKKLLQLQEERLATK